MRDGFCGTCANSDVAEVELLPRIHKDQFSSDTYEDQAKRAIWNVVLAG
jgi:hypothetical protein